MSWESWRNQPNEWGLEEREGEKGQDIDMNKGDLNFRLMMTITIKNHFILTLYLQLDKVLSESMPGWAALCDSEKVKCWAMQEVFIPISFGWFAQLNIWGLTWLNHPIRFFTSWVTIDSPVSFRRRALLGSLTDDSAKNCPQTYNYKKVQWTSFLLDGYLNYLQGEKLKIKCFQKNFLFTLILPEPVLRLGTVPFPGVAWVPCESRPASNALFLLWASYCLLLLGLGIEPITETMSKCSQNVHVLYL